jgi:hypothetical protein
VIIIADKNAETLSQVNKAGDIYLEPYTTMVSHDDGQALLAAVQASKQVNNICS